MVRNEVSFWSENVAPSANLWSRLIEAEADWPYRCCYLSNRTPLSPLPKEEILRIGRRKSRHDQCTKNVAIEFKYYSTHGPQRIGRKNIRVHTVRVISLQACTKGALIAACIREKGVHGLNFSSTVENRERSTRLLYCQVGPLWGWGDMCGTQI